MYTQKFLDAPPAWYGPFVLGSMAALTLLILRSSRKA